MGDLNEHSSSSRANSDGHPGAGTGMTTPISKPIWRLRPTLKSTGMVEAIKTQLIPKIVLALRTLPLPKAPARAEPVATFDIEQFTGLVLGHDEAAASAFVESLRAQGTPVESILLHLMAPVARQLGEMWESDATDFANVTLGVSRMQRIMRQLGETFSDDRRQTGGSVLLTTIPGEQHSFGMSMVAEFFRREGWQISTGPFASHRDLRLLAQDRWFDIVGFSVTSDRRLDELKRDIDEVRRESRNRNVGIMLGGPMMITHPELVDSLGADMMSIDASTAPRQASEFVASLTNPT
jgi:methanogenic corrinoid protein MtbC1